MTSDIDAVATFMPDVPTIVIAVVVAGALFATAIESADVTKPPGGGVTGFGLNPPVTPAGRGAVRVTGEEKPPPESTVTVTVAVAP
jgi:hypothetical protein